MFKQVYSKVSNTALNIREKFRPGTEADKATRFWGGLDEYHLSNDSDPIAIARSKWLTTDILPVLNPQSILEIGCNSGRNLFYVKDAFPTIDAKGIDINPKAIRFARATKPDIVFEISDANSWEEPVDRWDCALTMSVTDHIPAAATRGLAASIFASCRAIIGIELWDGVAGERALYKYSVDQRDVYESAGFTTLKWERVPERFQYDIGNSPLWIYVGKRPTLNNS